MPETKDLDGKGIEHALEAIPRDPDQAQPGKEFVAGAPYSRVLSINGKRITTLRDRELLGTLSDEDSSLIMMMMMRTLSRYEMRCSFISSRSQPKGHGALVSDEESSLRPLGPLGDEHSSLRSHRPVSDEESSPAPFVSDNKNADNNSEVGL